MDLTNNKISEVVVVEGYHDLAKLKEVFEDIDVVITNGSEISEETLKELKLLNQKRGLILFLDPDYQGERIRRIINDYVGETKHAFLKKKDCISKNKKKVGIEHASNEVIYNALTNLLSMKKGNSMITITELTKLGLVGKIESKILRKELCEQLGIGLCNGKTLCNKLNMFQISISDIEAMIGK